MATAGSFIFRWMHWLSHCFSCGQTRPQTAGSAEVLFNTRAALRNSPRSMFLMNDGMLMLTGHPCIHVGLAQSRQRRASVMACSALSPIFTSSVRVVARYTGSSSGMTTREMAVRSFGFMAFRISCRHGALRSVSSLSEVVVSIWEASVAQAFSAWQSVLSGVLPDACENRCISSVSSFLKAPIRLSISSKST